MSEKFILVLDEGTTGTRALVIDKNSNIKAQAYTEFEQKYPAPNMVEHDAMEIWDKTLAMVKKALAEAKLQPTDIAAIGITNQRATTVVWDRKTDIPVHNAIVWQDTRTSGYIDSIRDQWAQKVLEHTGSVINAAYSAHHIRWILNNVPGLKERAQKGELAYGTIDSWLIFKMTGGKVHAVGEGNASQSQCYDLINHEWYKDWLDFLGIPMSMFGKVVDDACHIGDSDPEVFGAAVPITSALGDQMAALFGQRCLTPGTVKCTHGTGTFLDMNIGTTPAISKRGLNCIVAWRWKGETTYMLEGFASVTGSAIQWLRDGAEMIQTSKETEELAKSVDDNGGVYFVPALAGLQAPWWDNYARGMIIGITRGTKRAHIVRATLEGIVYATKDFLETMRADSGVGITSIKVDGGASQNDWLMQFQADMLNAEVVRPTNPEATSLGAAYMAGLVVGYWKDTEDCFASYKADKIFKPQMPAEKADALYAEWTKAVKRTLGWAK